MIVMITGCAGGASDRGPVESARSAVASKVERATPSADELTTHTSITRTGVIPVRRRVPVRGFATIGRQRPTDAVPPVVVASTWSVRCGPCLRQERELARLADSIGPQRLGVALVTAEAGTDGVRPTAQSGLPVLDERTVRLQAAIAALIPVSGAPVTVVIDEQQRIAAAFAGLTSWRMLAETVAAVADGA